jgi:site-specific recombinase XerD
MDSNEILVHFEQYVFAKGLTRHSCSELSFCIKEFLLYLEINKKLNFELISEATISNYHHYLINRKKYNSIGKLSGSTPNHHVYALNTFFAWLHNINAISYNPMLDLQLPKSYSTKALALPKEVIKKLFSVAQTDLERVVLAIY